MFRTITARYANSICKRCGTPIAKGSKFRYGGRGRTYHLKTDCSPTADQVYKVSDGFAGRSLDESAFGEPVDDEPLDTRGPMHEANDVAMERWAERYDDRNGAPENDFDF